MAEGGGGAISVDPTTPAKATKATGKGSAGRKRKTAEETGDEVEAKPAKRRSPKKNAAPETDLKKEVKKEVEAEAEAEVEAEVEVEAEIEAEEAPAVKTEEEVSATAD